MTDEEIRNLAVQYTLTLVGHDTLIKMTNSHEFMTLADEIFDFIKNGTIPAAP